jgi:hypothetical protein
VHHQVLVGVLDRGADLPKDDEAFADGRGKPEIAIFGAVDEVDQVLRQRLRHFLSCFALAGLLGRLS